MSALLITLVGLTLTWYSVSKCLFPLSTRCILMWFHVQFAQKNLERFLIAVPSSKQNKKERAVVYAYDSGYGSTLSKQIFLKSARKNNERHYSIKPASTNDQVWQFWKHAISSADGRFLPAFWNQGHLAHCLAQLWQFGIPSVAYGLLFSSERSPYTDFGHPGQLGSWNILTVLTALNIQLKMDVFFSSKLLSSSPN